MICPRCNTNLTLSNTQGIDIDFCPNCKGVWLDRGELEKIIERSNSFASPFSRNDEHFSHHDKHHDSHHEKHHDGHSYNNHDSYNDSHHGHQSKHKKSFLSELFDF